MERSMTQREFQEETLAMNLVKRGIIPSMTREEALKKLEEQKAKSKEKK